MLLEFKFSNYISYKEETVVSFEKRSKESFGKDNIIEQNGHKVLNAHCFVGVNGSGKSVFCEALVFMAKMVLNSSNHNRHTKIRHPRFAGSKPRKPIKFEITFLSNGKKYIYGFTYIHDRIISEFTKVYESQKATTLFSRKFNFKINNYIYTITKNKASLKEIKKQVIPQTLFLSRAVQLNSKELIPVFEFFTRLGSQKIDIDNFFDILQDSKIKDKFLDILSYADLSINDFELIVDTTKNDNQVSAQATLNDGTVQNLPVIATNYSLLLSHKTSKSSFKINFNAESTGTQKFIHVFIALLNTRDDEIIIFDEIETSWNLEIVKFTLDYIKSEKPNCQLIFTTHQPEIINWLRSDQIHIVEKEDSVSRITNLHSIISSNSKINKNYGDYYREGVLGGQPKVYNPYD